MSFRKLWYVVTLVAFAILPLTGCSSNGNSVQTTPKGIQLTVDGKVDASKASSKAVSLTAGDANSVTVYNAQDGSALGTATVDGSGKFSGLTFTLTSAKTVLVFKATVAQGVFRSIVPLDLSNPPAAGITASNTINISISQDSNNIAVAVSQRLGLAGILGDAGMTLAAVSKTFADVVALVLENGGQVLAYNTSGLALSGSIGSAALLPAKDASTFTFDDLNDIKLDAKITSAFIPSTNPIVNFQVTNKATGKGISGLRTFGLHIAKLIPEGTDGTSSIWVNYIDKGIAVPAGSGAGATAATKPSADPATSYNADGTVKVNGYKVIDHGDGSYTAIFASDVTTNANNDLIHNYDAAKIHRIGVTVTTVAVPGVTATGPINPTTNAINTNINPVNRLAFVYDFTPATGLPLLDANNKPAFARDTVTNAGCEECHYSLSTIPNPDQTKGGALLGHTQRPNVRLCVICHTSTNTGGEGEFVTFIHRIHMGERLNDSVAANGSFKPIAAGLVKYGEHTYPQDIRGCTKCHKGGVDSANWSTKANRKNCGSCHNALNFATHQGGQADDKFCSGCHVGAGAIKEVAAAHITVDPTYNNPNTPAGLSNFTYVINSVTLNASSQPVIAFQIKKDNAAVTFNTFAATAGLVPVTGFSGGPTLYVVYSVPQDGITAPADFNARSSVSLTNLWNGTQGTLSGPVAGVYTATLTGTTAAPIKVPASASMLTGALIGNFTQTTVTPNVVRDTIAVQKVATGFKARRTIVDTAKCNKCHEQLGLSPSFHGGARNDATLCAFCHTANQTSSGWTANANTFIHGIHASAKRSVPFTWHAVSATDTYYNVTFPGYLRNCEMCHVAGTNDFSAAATLNAVPNMLWPTVAKGKYDGASATAYTLSPYVIKDNLYDYGVGFSYNPATDATTPAAATTLVSSPIASACFSCHDTNIAKAHMIAQGGSIYEARSTALLKTETCVVCHGTASNTLNGSVPSIKAAHRWW